ncbi:glycosyltransferase family 39 protein, partial [Burkholderia pseudomallei]
LAPCDSRLERANDKPTQGALWCGRALGHVAQSGNPVLVAALALGTLAVYLVTREIRCVHLPARGLPLAVAVCAVWPLGAYIALPD